MHLTGVEAVVLADEVHHVLPLVLAAHQVVLHLKVHVTVMLTLALLGATLLQLVMSPRYSISSCSSRFSSEMPASSSGLPRKW